MRRNVIITVVLSVAFLLLGGFVFWRSYVRFWETLQDLGRSVGFYFGTLFGIEHSITPTVTEFSSVMRWDILLPSDFKTFTERVQIYLSLLIDKENFAGYWQVVGRVAKVIAKVIAVGLPCVVVFWLILKRLYAGCNTRHNRDTVPLRIFKRVSGVTYQPLKKTILSFIDFLREHGGIRIFWIVLWVFHLNFASIVVAFFAFYFYFALTFDAVNIYVQVCKLFIDLQVPFRHFPWWSILTVCWLLFCRWRKRVALNRLRHFEARNCGFINEMPIVSMSCGSMGKKKTTLITDMILSQEVMFRQKALEILQRNDMKFPYFPWISLEDGLREAMDGGRVYNLATVKEWVRQQRELFEQTGEVFGYDHERYGAMFDDALRVNELFDVLETYALAYFISDCRT